MEPKKRSMLIAALSGAIGGSLGAVSGSRSIIVVISVAAVFSALIAWAINGMIK